MTMTVLISIIAALLLLGPLVTVHEFGHFLLARLFGVKVIRFSVGFGRPLLKWTSPRSGTEFALARFPLGGYVKMLDRREGDIPKGEEKLEFMAHPAWERILIVVAGPLFNVLFALLVYFIILIPGESHWKPVIADVFPDTVVERAGFFAGDEILTIDGKTIPDWQTANQTLLTLAMERREAELSVKSASGEFKNLRLDLGAVDVTREEDRYLLVLGMRPVFIPPVRIDTLSPGMPAEVAGLQPGDVILGANGKQVYSFGELAKAIQEGPGEQQIVAVLRDLFIYAYQLTPQMAEVDGVARKQIGVAFDAEKYYTETEPFRFAVRYSPVGTLVAAVEQTYDTTKLISRGLWSIVTGRASLRNISGPVRIADIAGSSLGMGWLPFLHMMAFVSISLAIVNILPVPVLDGGHVVFYAIEMVKGSPVSERFFAWAQKIGLAILVLLMTVAFYNDLSWLIS